MKAHKKGVKPNGVVTMRDVALKAGVSQGTVSRVLNGTPTSISISSDTQQRVMQAVEELGYYPNLAARTLRTQRTHLIAIMIADISNPFYHSIVRTIQDIVRVKDYDVMIANTDHHYEDEKRFCAAVMRRAVDGVIMVPFHLSTEEIDQVIKRTGTSIVALGKHITHPEVDLVYADDQLATYQGVHWLIADQGHQHIGFIGVPDSFPPGPRRLHGYEAALTEAGIALNPEYMVFGDFTAETGYQSMQNFLSLPTPPTAVFCCNDRIAIGAIAAAQDMGRRVPTDVAVIGFDNIPEATLIRPHLTTMAQHPVEMARQLAQALLERIEGKYTGTQRMFEVPCTLIRRDSA
ncbi:MAG: LacI family DNA-binding transcriptional regulator [Anaerolineae bacterium]|nr:LacI family DNA-binding transcriptional regulator [Anaerolineae bacterium]